MKRGWESFLLTQPFFNNLCLILRSVGSCCGNSKLKRERLAFIGNQINSKIKTKEMAKDKYKVLDGVAENARLRLGSAKYSVKDLTQSLLKVLYDAGHPQVEKIGTEAKKDA